MITVEGAEQLAELSKRLKDVRTATCGWS